MGGSMTTLIGNIAASSPTARLGDSSVAFGPAADLKEISVNPSQTAKITQDLQAGRINFYRFPQSFTQIGRIRSIRRSPAQTEALVPRPKKGFTGFGLGTSLGTPFTMIPPRLFHTLSQSTVYSVQCTVYRLSLKYTSQPLL